MREDPLKALFDILRDAKPKDWSYCMEHGHKYQVVGRFKPTKIRCHNCKREWEVT